jgi:hypothetical protein
VIGQIPPVFVGLQTASAFEQQQQLLTPMLMPMRMMLSS